MKEAANSKQAVREFIAEKYNLGDCLGFEALKLIATEEDCKVLDELIKTSWEVVDGTCENEEQYYELREKIFTKYGFKFDAGDMTA
jgi:hypothetical protein